MPEPLLVVVTGPPGAGKSTIARALADDLGLPLIAKDGFKETLFRTLPAGTVEETRLLGIAAWDALFSVVGELLRAGVSLVAEGNFADAGRFAALPPVRLVQLHLSAPADVLVRRYRERPRHPGHQTEAYADEIAARIAAGEWAPLDLPGELIAVDTTAPVDIGALARQLSR